MWSTVENLKKFSEVSERLAVKGIELQEELLIMMLLSRLPKDYENFVIAMGSLDTIASFNILREPL